MRRSFILPALIVLALAAPLVGSAWQSDTNATTSVTTKTPDKPSDILLGKTGGTNTVWVNHDGTTNGWVKVSN